MARSGLHSIGPMLRVRGQHLWPMLIPVLFVVVCLTFGVTELNFDVLERSYLLEHPAECLVARDGSPQSQFLFYAHILELPLAFLLGGRWLGVSGVHALILFETICGAIVLVLVHRIVRWWGGRPAAAVVAQIALAFCLAFWRMSSGGEEKIVAFASQLLFLAVFWAAARDGRSVRWVAPALALAILVHLTAVVLVPFALLALAVLPPGWRPNARRTARAVAAGCAAAFLAFMAVAASTTHVRSLGGLIEYATFYHRKSGTNFFELGHGPIQWGTRIGRVIWGASSFLGVEPWGRMALATLAILLMLGVVRALVARRIALSAASVRRRGGAAAAMAPGGGDAGSALCLVQHAALACVLWTAHFAFYQPQSYENWTLPLALAIITCAVLWSAAPAILLVVPLLAVAGNHSYMVQLHRDDPLNNVRAAVEAVTRPGDVLLLQGGRVDGQLTQGSLAMRYFLTMLPDRRIVSLHDVLHVGEGEYWHAPYTSAAELQAAIESGVRVITPAMLSEVFEKIASTQALDIETRPAAPGLLQVVAFRPLRAAQWTPDQLRTTGSSAAPPGFPGPR